MTYLSYANLPIFRHYGKKYWYLCRGRISSKKQAE